MDNNPTLTDEQLSADHDLAQASGEAPIRSQGQARAKHNPEKRLYEILYIVSNQYTEVELEKIKEKVEGVLVKFGATIVYQESLGKRRLAYPIAKINHGYYVLNEFDLENDSTIKDINHELRLDKEVLRFQIIIKPRVAQEAPVRKPRKENLEAKIEKPVKENKKANLKNLDEKLEEILEQDEIL